MPRRRDHARERLLAILELLRLRDEAVRLDGIAETGGGLLAPRIEGFGLGQAIEAVVDFDRIERPRIISEPSFGRTIFGIAGAAPWPIVHARPAVVDPVEVCVHGHGACGVYPGPGGFPACAFPGSYP